MHVWRHYTLPLPFQNFIMVAMDDHTTPADRRVKCNNLFVNLLHFHEQPEILSSAYIREFFETARCDAVFDMAPYRAEYEKKLTKERLDRILMFKSTDDDELVAAQAAMHYHSWHHTFLLKSLSTSSWVYYHAVTRVEKTAALFGVASFVSGGLYAALNSFRYLRLKRLVRSANADPKKD